MTSRSELRIISYFILARRKDIGQWTLLRRQWKVSCSCETYTEGITTYTWDGCGTLTELFCEKAYLSNRTRVICRVIIPHNVHSTACNSSASYNVPGPRKPRYCRHKGQCFSSGGGLGDTLKILLSKPLVLLIEFYWSYVCVTSGFYRLFPLVNGKACYVLSELLAHFFFYSFQNSPQVPSEDEASYSVVLFRKFTTTLSNLDVLSSCLTFIFIRIRLSMFQWPLCTLRAHFVLWPTWSVEVFCILS